VSLSGSLRRAKLKESRLTFFSNLPIYRSLGKYYFWNRKTNTTTWTNPFEAEDAAAAAAAASSTSSAAASGSVSPTQAASVSGSSSEATKAKAGSPQPVKDTPSTDGTKIDNTEAAALGPSAASFGGIDPDLAYLDPSLAGRARSAGGAGAYAARFNARTGRFEGDPNKNPDRVSDVQRAKRQNQFYFDYDGWQATLAQQQEQTTLKRAGGDLEDDDSKRNRPSKKEMDAIKARNKEKKDKKQKGWLLS
jgi:hypothetical protein